MATTADKFHGTAMKHAARHEGPIQRVLEALWMNAHSVTDTYILKEALEECPTAMELLDADLTGMSLPQYVSEAILDNTLPAIRETWRRLSWTLHEKRKGESPLDIRECQKDESAMIRYGVNYSERVILEGLLIVDAYTRLGHARGAGIVE